MPHHDGEDLFGISPGRPATSPPSRGLTGGVRRRRNGPLIEVDGVEARAILFQHTVFAQTGLPYRDPGNDYRAWEQINGAVHLRVEAGAVFDPDAKQWRALGLPFGPKPRLILAYLNREALIQNAPEIDVGESLTAFVRRLLGYDPNGQQIRLFKDQLLRLAAATVRLGMAHDGGALQINSRSITEVDLTLHHDERQRVFWPSTITLSPEYFASLRQHAVPLDEHAIAALAHSAMALDLYAWLAQRLRRVEVGRPAFVPWPTLREQFGWHYRSLRKFRQAFRDTLAIVLEQYQGARITVTERGLDLQHSPPPIRDRLVPLPPR